MTSEVILHFMKNLCLHKVRIAEIFIKSVHKRICYKENKINPVVTESHNHGVF